MAPIKLTIDQTGTYRYNGTTRYIGGGRHEVVYTAFVSGDYKLHVKLDKTYPWLSVPTVR